MPKNVKVKSFYIDKLKIARVTANRIFITPREGLIYLNFNAVNFFSFVTLHFDLVALIELAYLL